MLAVLVPMLGRGELAAALTNSIHEATPVPHEIMFVASHDDEPTIEACADLVHTDGTVTVAIAPWPGGERGDYARKINRACTLTDTEWVFTGAIDLRFHDGWWDAAMRHVRPGVLVVGTNDYGNRRTMVGKHSTHTLVHRSYIDRGGVADGPPGMLLHEGYWHEYVDDEMVRTAQHRGVWAHSRRSVVEHLHPSWGKAPTDALYDQQAERMADGRALFLARQHLWGGTVRA